MHAKDKQIISAAISKSEVKRIDLIAERRNLTRSEVLRQLIIRSLETFELK